jgi:hypothetical protein
VVVNDKKDQSQGPAAFPQTHMHLLLLVKRSNPAGKDVFSQQVMFGGFLRVSHCGLRSGQAPIHKYGYKQGTSLRSWQLRSATTQPPTPSRWTFGRMLKYLSVTSLAFGSGYITYYYYFEQRLPPADFSIFFQSLPKNNSNEKLVVRRMSDTLAMYQRSIGEALNEDPIVENMRLNTKQLEQALSELQLTKDQVKRLETAEAAYRQKNLQISVEIATKLNSVKSSANPLNKLKPNEYAPH